MRRLKLQIFLFCMLFTCLEANQEQTAKDKVHQSSIPSWVQQVDIPESDESTIHDGKIRLLIDEQYYDPESESYCHIATKFFTLSALQDDAQIQIAFFPHTQKILVHFIKIHRNGEIIDITKKCKQKIENLEKLHYLIYYDYDLLTLFPEDLRIGDVLEYAYTIKDEDSILSQNIEKYLHLDDYAFTQKAFFRIVANPDISLSYQTQGMNLIPQVKDLDHETKEWIWEAENLSPIPNDFGLPSWFSPNITLQISSFSNWNEVARLFANIFHVSQEFSPKIHEQILAWELTYESLEDRILTAIRFVQDEIRYLSLHEGKDEWFPHHPNDVFERRYGDCKDKSVLLVSLLRLLGIEAHPAFVHTELKQKFFERLPTIFSNHVIVYFEYENQPFFIDATHSLQGGKLDTLSPPPFGFALIAKEDTEELTEIPQKKEITKLTRILTFHINPYENKAKIDSTIISTGHWADFYRHKNSGIPLERLQEQYLSYFQRFYDDVFFSDEIDIHDDRDQNSWSVSYFFEVENFGEEEFNQIYFQLKPLAIEHAFPSLKNLSRKTPLAIPFPCHIEEIIHIIIDPYPTEGKSILRNFKEMDISTENDHFAIHLNKKKEGVNQYLIHVEMENFVDAIEPEKLKDVKKILRKYMKSLHSTYTIPIP